MAHMSEHEKQDILDIIADSTEAIQQVIESVEYLRRRIPSESLRIDAYLLPALYSILGTDSPFLGGDLGCNLDSLKTLIEDGDNEDDPEF